MKQGKTYGRTQAALWWNKFGRFNPLICGAGAAPHYDELWKGAQDEVNELYFTAVTFEEGTGDCQKIIPETPGNL